MAAIFIILIGIWVGLALNYQAPLFYRFVPVLTVGSLPYGRGFALPFLIVVHKKVWEYRDRRETLACLTHEFVHIRQWWRYLIVGFIVIYLWDSLVCAWQKYVGDKPYKKFRDTNRLEIEAEIAERRARNKS